MAVKKSRFRSHNILTKQDKSQRNEGTKNNQIVFSWILVDFKFIKIIELTKNVTN